MSRRYTYSRTLRTLAGEETFTAEQFDSFDEAKKAVDKGIHDRKLEVEKETMKANPLMNNRVIPATPPTVPGHVPDGGSKEDPEVK